MSAQINNSERKELAELNQAMLQEDESLIESPNWILQEGKWYTNIVKTVFKSDINSFIRARAMYNKVKANNSDYAFIYRRPDLTQSKDMHRKAAKVVSDFIKQLLTQAPNANKDNIEQLMQYMKADAAKYKQKSPNFYEAYDNVIKLIESSDIFPNIIQTSSNKYNEGVINKCFEKLDERIVDLSEETFFKNADVKALRLKNIIYHPGLYHNWGSNLAWLLANLKSGKNFHVISDILIESNKYRASSDEEYSAFAKEICAALKAGYEISKKGDVILLSPSVFFVAENCITNGNSGNGVNPSDEEVEAIYSTLQIALSSGYNFTFNLVRGLKLNSELLFQYQNSSIATLKIDAISLIQELKDLMKDYHKSFEALKNHYQENLSSQNPTEHDRKLMLMKFSPMPLRHLVGTEIDFSKLITKTHDTEGLKRIIQSLDAIIQKELKHKAEMDKVLDLWRKEDKPIPRNNPAK